MVVTRYLALVLPTLMLASPALAAEEDLQAWSATTASIPAGNRVVVWLEAQGRFSNDASRLGQLLLRPGLGYRLSPTTTAFVGYAYVRTDPVGPVRTNEHRIWQQLSFRAAGDGKSLTLTGRSRLEQRFVAGANDTGVRFRQLMRLTLPIDSGVQAVGWSEGFVALNNTDWGQRAGLDRFRNFAGVSVPLTKSMRLEPGYLNEYINATGSDRINHIASMTVNLNF